MTPSCILLLTTIMINAKASLNPCGQYRHADNIAMQGNKPTASA
jgi:hypothetical protein